MSEPDSLASLPLVGHAEVPDTRSPEEVPRLVGDRDYAVIVDPAGRAVGLVTAAEVASLAAATLADARLAPVVTLEADRTLAQLAGSPTMTLLELASDAAVLTRDERVVGVVAVATIAEELRRRRIRAPSRTMGPHGGSEDGSLPGATLVGRATVRCRAPGCGYPKALDFYDRRKPPKCDNPDLPPHTLDLAG
jgi:hypothetical protein